MTGNIRQYYNIMRISANSKNKSQPHFDGIKTILYIERETMDMWKRTDMNNTIYGTIMP
jgi:hypothetical protein